MMTKRRQAIGFQVMIALAFLGLIVYLFVPSANSSMRLSDSWYSEKDLSAYEPQVAEAVVAAVQKIPAPPVAEHKVVDPNRVKAAFVILARNSDLNGIRSSIRQIEDRFNRNFNYPYVFLNDESFTDEFKDKTSSLTKSQIYYGKLDHESWGYPDHINQTKAAECRKDMEERRIIYGGSESYRHMCR
jgi:alpha 1,2-mannosyltransferase